MSNNDRYAFAHDWATAAQANIPREDMSDELAAAIDFILDPPAAEPAEKKEKAPATFADLTPSKLARSIGRPCYVDGLEGWYLGIDAENDHMTIVLNRHGGHMPYVPVSLRNVIPREGEPAYIPGVTNWAVLAEGERPANMSGWRATSPEHGRVMVLSPTPDNDGDVKAFSFAEDDWHYMTASILTDWSRFA